MQKKNWKKLKSTLDGSWKKGKKKITLDSDYRGHLVYISSKPVKKRYKNFMNKERAKKYIKKYMEKN
tara:strand:+ start:996 stop:1196 length:201 start_codon:yes stop_codon:yes gene_type:complete